ncbi:HTH-type transcriptional regulator IscR [Phycisphaerae bacterium RAS1]|nr:HTH-type transcriptional regulator IscR [Phycisphaerae bacterium RAS1]
MLSLSHTSGYAVLALSCLDNPGQRWILAKDIAECTNAPGPYLSQILHALSRAGLIETKRGYQGGYRLCRPASAITVLEVVEAVDGPGCFGGCLLGLDECTDERACPTHEFWKAEKLRIRAYLAGLSLREVAAYEQRVLGCCASGTPRAGPCGNGRAGAVAGIAGTRLRERSPAKPRERRKESSTAVTATCTRLGPGSRTVQKRRRAR